MAATRQETQLLEAVHQGQSPVVCTKLNINHPVLLSSTSSPWLCYLVPNTATFAEVALILGKIRQDEAQTQTRAIRKLPITQSKATTVLFSRVLGCLEINY